jgi:hypothetical protein
MNWRFFGVLVGSPQENAIAIVKVPIRFQLADYAVHLALYFTTSFLMVRRMLEMNQGGSIPLAKEMERKSILMLLVSGLLWISNDSRCVFGIFAHNYSLISTLALTDSFSSDIGLLFNFGC